MRKLFRLIFICIFAVVLLMGCGTTQEPQEEEQEDTEEEVKEKRSKKKHDKDETDVTPKVKKEKAANVLLHDEDRVVLLKGEEEKVIFALPETGNDYISQAELIKDSIYIVDVEDMGADGFCSFIRVFDLDGNEIFSKDMGNETGSFSVDLYNDEIYIGFTEGYEDNSRRVYKYNTDSKDLTYDDLYSELWNTAVRNKINIGRNKSLFDLLNSKTEEIYAWSENDCKPVTVNRDTMDITGYLDITGFEGYVLYIAKVGDYMLLETYDPDEYFAYNLKDSSLTYIEGLDDYYCIDADDENFYFYKTDNSVYGLNSYHMSSLNAKTLEVRELYSVMEKPGHNYHYMQPGVTGFTVSEDYLYCVESDGISYFWKPYNMGNYSWEERQICPIKYNYADILTITYESFPKYTETERNVPYFNSYFETPHIKSEISNYADLINDQITDYMENEIKSWAESFSGQALENVDFCTPEDFGYTYSFDWNVTGAELIGNDYVEILFSGYEYSGGVHGYPYMDQLLFRRSTGERVYLADIIGVDEEMFSRIVAAKTVADMKSADEYKYFYDSDNFSGDSEYFDEIMSYARSYDGLPITYGQDGLTVYFPPYLLGPFSSGYIGILIDYDELNMKMD